MVHGLDGHVTGMHTLLLGRHGIRLLAVASTTVLRRKGKQVIGGVANVVVGVRVVLATTLLRWLEWKVVCPIHSSRYSIGL